MGAFLFFFLLYGTYVSYPRRYECIHLSQDKDQEQWITALATTAQKLHLNLMFDLVGTAVPVTPQILLQRFEGEGFFRGLI